MAPCTLEVENHLPSCVRPHLTFTNTLSTSHSGAQILIPVVELEFNQAHFDDSLSFTDHSWSLLCFSLSLHQIKCYSRPEFLLLLHQPKLSGYAVWLGFSKAGWGCKPASGNRASTFGIYSHDHIFYPQAFMRSGQRLQVSSLQRCNTISRFIRK